MLEMIRYNGGIDWIILKLTSRIRSTKGAEGSIAALISFANLCTANNTIAFDHGGPIAKDIADRFKIDPRRSASLLDIFSCFVQGIIPYGAQIIDGGRFRACLSHRDHAVFILSLFVGCRSFAGYHIQLSP